ncbi:MAG: serine/threonine protein kinase [Bacteroidaceae bacterium]|nr:serine/threonine protein kinase [Bacteroidaceae bacterium]
MIATNDINTSGIWTDSASDFSITAEAGYTDCTIIPSEGYALLVKAKRHGRWWVLKGLKPEYRQEPLYIELQKKEYSILSQLQHPYIVHVADMIEVEPYGTCLVMEYLEGHTLNEYLQDKPSKRQRIALAYQMLSAVSYMHSKQIVHRDLKPTNIIVTHNGDNLKIIDFGLSDTDSHYICKQPAGTVKYMSPEQMKHNEADVRNDIYSIGVILKELKLGWNVEPVISRCKRKIDKRYSDVAALKGCLDLWLKMPRMIVLGTLFLLIIAVAAIGWSKQSVNTFVVDEVQKSQVTLQESLRKDSMEILLLKDSIHNSYERERTRDSLEKVVENEQIRIAHSKDEILAKGKKMIVDKFTEYDNVKLATNDEILNALNEIQLNISKLVETEGAELNEQDQKELYNILMLEFSKIYDKHVAAWIEKMEQ